ncbi:MAG TPA: envelope stress response membrane protein PspB [Candidatus Acidoferrum sp.]|nr:envelope stress response membrane protein PspB [Candidatus Acidoferrum sp.]
MGQLIGLLATMMVFGMPIAIVWIVQHYKAKNSRNSELSEDESRQLQELLDIADSMADRIKNLERILDAEAPDWREQHDKQ